MAGETAKEFNRVLDSIESGVDQMIVNRSVMVAAAMLLDHLDERGPAAHLSLDHVKDRLREALVRAGRRVRSTDE